SKLFWAHVDLPDREYYSVSERGTITNFPVGKFRASTESKAEQASRAGRRHSRLGEWVDDVGGQRVGLIEQVPEGSRLHQAGAVALAVDRERASDGFVLGFLDVQQAGDVRPGVGGGGFGGDGVSGVGVARAVGE